MTDRQYARAAMLGAAKTSAVSSLEARIDDFQQVLTWRYTAGRSRSAVVDATRTSVAGLVAFVLDPYAPPLREEPA